MSLLVAQLGTIILIAYFLGSVPFGLLVGLANGKDPRKFGSGNIGATNAARALGAKKWFFLIFFLDMSKGLLPMLAASYILHRNAGAETSATYGLWLLAGLAAILGHVFSVFLKFKGGKGVATSAGVMFGLWPYYTIPGLISLVVFAAVFFIWRYVSLASIAAAISVPLTYVSIGLTRDPQWPVFGRQWPLLVFVVTISSLIIYKHRTNIARLRAGTESRFEKKKKKDDLAAQ